MTPSLNYVDVCFVVDTTGSMGAFLQAAQEQLLAILESFSGNNQIDLQVGLVEYRDRPPQEKSFITRAYPLTGKLKQVQQSIRKLRADGGGDAPEAVYEGVNDACKKMQWRDRSCRFVLLVGDAPPHGFANWLNAHYFETLRHRTNDAWPDGCPSGLDIFQVTAAAEQRQIVIHALCMGSDPLAARSFALLANGTGGQSALAVNAQEAIARIQERLTLAFQDLELDRQVLRAILSAMERSSSWDSEAIAVVLDKPRFQVDTAISRLHRRGFLNLHCLVEA